MHAPSRLLLEERSHWIATLHPEVTKLPSPVNVHIIYSYNLFILRLPMKLCIVKSDALKKSWTAILFKF